MERYVAVLGTRPNAAGAQADAALDSLPDAFLLRALAHAPDQRAAPDWRLRKSIHRRAHDAVGATDPDTDSAELERAARPRWRGKAALAAALGALLLGVLWWRSSPPAPTMEARITESAPSPVATAVPPRAQAPEPESLFPPSPPPSPASAQAAAPPPSLVLPLPPVAPLPPLPPLPPVRATAPLPAPPIGVAVAPPSGPTPGKSAPSVRTDETEPPTFEALSAWNRITIKRRDGESRTLSRAEARDLSALLGSAALSAVGPRPLAGAPEWRVTLERSGEVLAVFEVAGTQTRWREGKAPAATGVPSASALAALRIALQAAVQPPQSAEAAAPGAQPPRSP